MMQKNYTFAKKLMMHKFDYRDTFKTLLTPEIVDLLTTLHEYKGRQDLFIDRDSDTLTTLLDVAKIQSTKASNRIEGIFTSDLRLQKLVREKSEPLNRSEAEIAGYRDVLTTIHENYDYITPNSNTILQLHRDLYSFSGAAGGTFKISDNVITETADGKNYVRFVPTPAFKTPDAVNDLCENFNQAVAQKVYDPLLLIAVFTLDFLCIHPFNDGNGRMIRLLTLLLLYRSGYIAGKYISVEMLIEKTKTSYYESLRKSSEGWHENTNDYIPFVRYLLGVLAKAYSEFENRVEHLRYRSFSKADRVKAVFDKELGRIPKSLIAELCPDISVTTIERTLAELLAAGYIEKIGNGKTTAYIRK